MVTQSIKNRIPQSIKDTLYGMGKMPSFGYLQGLMNTNFRTDNLAIDKKAFTITIDRFLKLNDYRMEGFSGSDKQRDLSVRFHWGHNHDFGDFKLNGEMGNRHLYLLATFMDMFGVPLKSLHGKRVLDVGCWTGGTSLLLHALGAEVVAIEEVKKYADCLEYMAKAFNLKRLSVRNLSLFECTAKEFNNKFDYVLFAGVIYHITDPVVALRITYSLLKKGGTLLLETEAVNSLDKILKYNGPSAVSGGSRKDLSRSGWNWYIPSPPAVLQMLKDVGFTGIATNKVRLGRLYAIANKTNQVDMLRAGLSRKDIV
jgi:2-polyprenyl-3-methyl-5-hydroxy-6-metoxy-1,4-benzoquinol methylase